MIGTEDAPRHEPNHYRISSVIRSMSQTIVKSIQLVKLPIFREINTPKLLRVTLIWLLSDGTMGRDPEVVRLITCIRDQIMSPRVFSVALVDLGGVC